MIDFIITMKYLGGNTALTQLYASGMFSIGKINPERRIVGSIKPRKEINIACWIVFETVEMRMPNERLNNIYNMLSASRRTRLPFTGRSKTKYDSRRINITLMNESKKYGVTFPRII
jgi:hypothetical protein